MQSKYLCKEMAYIPLKYNTFMPFSLHNIRNPVLIEIMLFIFHNYNGQLANKIMEMFLCKKRIYNQGVNRVFRINITKKSIFGKYN